MVKRKDFTLYIQVEASGNPLRASVGRGKPHRIKMKRKQTINMEKTGIKIVLFFFCRYKIS